MVKEKEENVTHRRRAMESLRSILNFLSTKDSLRRFLQVGNKFELNLEKNVPDNPYHKNLVLVFEPTLTSGGAKFSLRSDGRFTITIYVPYRNTKEMWLREFPNHVRDWLLGRRSSYIHEFTHYLDIRDQQLDKISPPDPNNNKQYYNHPWEVRAFIQQGLSDIEDAVEVKLLNQQKLWVREFGMTENQFVANAMRKYLNPEFLRYLTPENKKLVDEELRMLFQELIKTLRGKSNDKTDIREDNVLKRILDPPKTPNLTLKMAYQDQADQEEADKDMSKKAIMQFVAEITRKVVNEAFGETDSNTKKGKEWKDINKLDKSHKYLPDDEPDQKEADKQSRKLGDLFPKMDNLGRENSSFSEAVDFPGAKINMNKPMNAKLVARITNLALYGEEDAEILNAVQGEIDNVQVTPRWVKFVADMARKGRLSEATSKQLKEHILSVLRLTESGNLGADSFQGGAFGFGAQRQLADPVDHMPPEEDDTTEMQLPSSRDREGLGSSDLTDDDMGLRLYNSLTELVDELDERTEADAMYRDLPGMAIDPDANDKNFDPEPPAPEEFGADHHVGGMGKILAPHRFLPADTTTSQVIGKARLAEQLAYNARMIKLGVRR